MEQTLDSLALRVDADTALERAISAVSPQVLAHRIRGARGDALQAKVASEAGISAPFLSKLERGYARPSGETLRAIAEATGWPVEDFVKPDAERPFGKGLTRTLSSIFSSKPSDDSRSAR